MRHGGETARASGENWWLAISMNVEKRRELAVFLFLTLMLAPLIAILVVAGYGFMVWIYQMIMGPPTV